VPTDITRTGLESDDRDPMVVPLVCGHRWRNGRGFEEKAAEALDLLASGRCGWGDNDGIVGKDPLFAGKDALAVVLVDVVSKWERTGSLSMVWKEQLAKRTVSSACPE
jgi:hypothetical protein